MRRYPRKTTLVLFILAGLATSFIFFLRFPNNLIEPNFYAEDGSVYLKNIEANGFIQAIFTTFNGYFISGLYLLEGIGYAVNGVIFQGAFIHLPQSLATVSYLFLGFTCALPVLLFRRHAPLVGLSLVVVLSAFVPMPGYDYAIIGTIGNLKFIFVFIAFLLLLYRHYLPESNYKRFVIVDVLLLICAYTNVVVYLLMPFALLRYVPEIRFDKKKLKNLFKHHSVQSLIVLALLMLPQLIIVKLFGIPSMPGYLDAPYQFDATINTFIYRTYLFPFLPELTSSLNDVIVVFAFIVLNVILWFGLKGKRTYYAFGMIAAFLITLLFVMNRTGVTELFKTYLSSGPDQFFYTQNLIVCFLLGIAVVSLIQKISIRIIKAGVSLLLAVAVAFLYIPAAGSYGGNDFMQRTVKNIFVNTQAKCEEHKDTIDIQLYPVNTNDFPLKNIERSRVCTQEVLEYTPPTQYLPFDSLGGGFIADIEPSDFRQTFKSDYNGLNGISITFLTYKQEVRDTYTLHVFKSDCVTQLRSAVVPANSIQDTKYTRIEFNKINNSKDKNYCLSLAVKKPKTQTLALALSKEDLYEAGQLTANDQVRSDDVLIRLHYSK
ncbi:hypothetical protein KBD20_02055 [Candidatus Saccharibacteria bacterium]|nr:hypothetical protein [Candidatus Saccharibacteria bacterium]